MALPPESAQGVITERYRDLDILVPEWSREHSTELLENQKRAIDLGAVLQEDVKDKTVDFFGLGWAFQESPHQCWHLNIPPVTREKLIVDYPTWIPLSLVERKGVVVAGVFAIPVRESFRLPSERIWKYLNVKIEWPCFKKLSRNHLTHLPLQPKVNPDTRKLASIFSTLRENASHTQLKMEVRCYMCNLEPRRLGGICPSWWPPQLRFSSLDCLSNDQLIHVAACVLSHYKNQVTTAIKDGMPWTTTIQTTWNIYQSSRLVSEVSWQARDSDSSSTNMPMLPSTLSTSYHLDTSPPTILYGEDSPINTNKVKEIIRDVQSNNHLGKDEQFNYSDRIGQRPCANMPLRSNETEPAPTDPKDYAFDEHTKIRFVPKDALKNLSKLTGCTRFTLSDAEQLKLFCRKRLMLLSKGVLEEITCCWYERQESRQLSEPFMKIGGRTRLHATGKKDIVSEAVGLLLEGGATEHNKAISHDSWIMDLEQHTTPIVEDMSASQFSENVTKEFVKSKVLSSLFYVAQLYENLCQQTSNGRPSNYETIIEWSQYGILRKEGVKRENTADSELPQEKRQCVRKASITQYDSTVHRPIDPPTSAYASATCFPLQASPWSHEPQTPGWEQNALDCPYEVLQYRTVTHADTNFTLATSLRSINNITMQPNYTSIWNQHTPLSAPTAATTAPSLVLADYPLADEAFSDLRTYPTRFPTHPVPVSELESTTAHAAFVHYNIQTIPSIPVSENCYSTQSLKSLPENATVSDIRRRLDLDNDTHSYLLRHANRIRDSTNFKSTYTWTKIPDATKDELVLKIVNNAPVQLKKYYDIGKDGENDTERN